MPKELKEGIYIAQSPEVNILIRVVGKAPLLSIIGAIDLNEFYQTGKVKNLSEDSIEILDIMSCPEKYRFELPSITTAIESIGINKELGRTLSDITDNEESEFVHKYQELVRLYGSCDKADNRMILWLKKEKNIAISQGRFVIEKIKKLIQSYGNQRTC